MKKTNVKRIFSVICLLVVSCLVFSGCASVNYSVVVGTDGSVQQGFQVTLDKSKITLAGYDYSDIASKIENAFNNAVNQNQLNIIKFCSASGKKPLNCDCGIKTNYERIDEQNFYGYIAFESISIYREYSNFISGGSSEDDNEDDSGVEENLFFIKDVDYNDTVYTGIDAKDENGEYTNSIVKTLTDYFDGSTEGTQQFTLDDVEYNFYYGVPTTKLHSNSDSTISQSGIEIHQWTFNASNLNDPIQTWTIKIKPVAWYVLALVLTIILIIILFIICLIKKKSKKVKNTIAQQENS